MIIIDCFTVTKDNDNSSISRYNMLSRIVKSIQFFLKNFHHRGIEYRNIFWLERNDNRLFFFTLKCKHIPFSNNTCTCASSDNLSNVEKY